MKIETIQHLKNPILKREEYKLQIVAQSNPSFEDVKNHFGKDAELIVVKRIKGNFGLSTFLAEAFVYDTKEAKDQTERIPRKIRKKMAEEAKKAEEAKAIAGAK